MITLEANYSKKIGLPGYSSHQFSITLRSELTDVNQVQQESARLYQLLQDGVDSSIQEIGYLPKDYGKLIQLYGVHKASIEARKKGYSVMRQSKQDGSIKLVMMGVGI
jgi:hypothetical protein